MVRLGHKKRSMLIKRFEPSSQSSCTIKEKLLLATYHQLLFLLGDNPTSTTGGHCPLIPQQWTTGRNCRESLGAKGCKSQAKTPPHLGRQTYIIRGLYIYIYLKCFLRKRIFFLPLRKFCIFFPHYKMKYLENFYIQILSQDPSQR